MRMNVSKDTYDRDYDEGDTDNYNYHDSDGDYDRDDTMKRVTVIRLYYYYN